MNQYKWCFAITALMTVDAWVESAVYYLCIIAAVCLALAFLVSLIKFQLSALAKWWKDRKLRRQWRKSEVSQCVSDPEPPAFRAGWSAFCTGAPLESNPHRATSFKDVRVLSGQWRDGWYAARDKHMSDSYKWNRP